MKLDPKLDLKGLALVSPWILYALYSLARHDLRVDHILVVAFVSALAFASARSRELMRGLYPIGLVFIVYDGMRPYRNVGLTPARVHLCDLRAVEASLFGSGGNTVHDYFVAHHVPALDLVCAVPYATFIIWCAAGAVFLYFRDRPAMKRFMWGFFLMNVAAFVTYHVLPAAPPWYFHEHGCVVDLATKPSEGPTLARVDAMIGFSYFHGMYAKASSVFGALPSLHCAYPFLLLLEGWRAFGRKMRIAAVAYYLLMVFSAVYLDHHWLLDALLGTAFAAGAFGVMRLRLPMLQLPELERPARRAVLGMKRSAPPEGRY